MTNAEEIYQNIRNMPISKIKDFLEPSTGEWFLYGMEIPIFSVPICMVSLFINSIIYHNPPITSFVYTVPFALAPQIATYIALRSPKVKKYISL